MAATKLHADDIPVPVLAPGRGRTKTGRLWTYVRDDRASADATPPAVSFRYTPDRKGERPRQHLKAFSGALQADDYAGFHHLYTHGTIVEAACWARVRRKFYDIHKATAAPIAADILERIAGLYQIESAVRGQAPMDRCAARQACAGPVLVALKQQLESVLSQVST